jgi:hypothetical protein
LKLHVAGNQDRETKGEIGVMDELLENKKQER